MVTLLVFFNKTGILSRGMFAILLSICGIIPETGMVNETDICLIPKIVKPEFISQFRPISLCNTVYIILTKVVVNR